jgi:ABC-type transport system involved in cytochrome c biogenesis permease subunit
MKKHLSALLALALGLFLLVGGLFPPAADPAFDLEGFGRLPVLADGRIKPMDTVARSSLLIMQGRQRVIDREGQRLPPVAWLLDVFYRPERSETHPHFEIVHPDVLALFRLDTKEGEGGKRFSYRQLEPRLEELDRQAALAEDIPSAVRTPFQRAVLNTRYHLVLFQQLRHSLVPPGRPDFLGELQAMEDTLPAALHAVRLRQAGQEHDESLARELMTRGQVFVRLEQFANLLPIPPLNPAAGPEAWAKTGQVLLHSFQSERINPYALTYAALGQAWRDQDAERFNTLVQLYTAQLGTGFGPELQKAAVESRFNGAAPFYRSQVLYLLAFLLAVFSWLRWPESLARASFWLVALAFVATTAGIATRMWLEGRPPVTNLYSSALFVGWGSVGLCLIIEAIYRNGIGAVAGSAVGFCTLLVAHHLSLGGDTLEMMRAVLDSNFWLATHVIVITIGYSAVFLAGFLAIIYVVRGLFTKSLDEATAVALERMVYGIICFATLFNLVGTVLGGIWADQSWGRFWGWDPKENGALMIVLWCAIMLHARWGKLVNTRGLMALAIGGNIITSWSWFGTNMLGIGLHSYGFMDAAFFWLMTFVLSQLALIALALLPAPRWSSPAAAR